MNHRSIGESDLHAYVDGELNHEGRAEVEAHLSNNAEDAAKVAAFRAQNAALKAALDPVLQEPLPKRLSLEFLSPSVRGQRANHRMAMAASVAFAVGILLGGGGTRLIDHRLMPASVSNDAGATVARAAVEAHRVFGPEVLHPVEVRGADEQHLLQWLSKRLGYPMALPDLKGEGFSLVGGRLLSGNQGPAAFFMFESLDGTRLTLYCGRMKPVQDSAFRYTETDGVGTVYWTADNIGFAVTGSLERVVLQRLAERFFASMEQEPKRPT
jgi:anti-sigma factor RsiW